MGCGAVPLRLKLVLVALAGCSLVGIWTEEQPRWHVTRLKARHVPINLVAKANFNSDSAYGRLGVPENADDQTIRRAYLKLCTIVHPDKGGNEEDFKNISEAYEILRDPRKLAAYKATGGSIKAFKEVPPAGTGRYHPYPEGFTEADATKAYRRARAEEWACALGGGLAARLFASRVLGIKSQWLLQFVEEAGSLAGIHAYQNKEIIAERLQIGHEKAKRALNAPPVQAVKGAAITAGTHMCTFGRTIHEKTRCVLNASSVKTMQEAAITAGTHMRTLGRTIHDRTKCVLNGPSFQTAERAALTARKSLCRHIATCARAVRDSDTVRIIMNYSLYCMTFILLCFVVADVWHFGKSLLNH